MIYIDTSVALAHLFAEDRAPPKSFWSEQLVSSRLLAYEIWTRIHARGDVREYGPLSEKLLDEVTLTDLSSPALARALEPFPLELRTLDALHVSTMVWLRSEAFDISLATYDRRMRECAHALGFALYPA